MMGEAKHTPEPWRATRTAHGVEIAGGSADVHLAFFSPAMSVWADGRSYRVEMDECGRNADRAAACVNALAGVQDVETFVRWLAALRDSHERLRTALQDIVDVQSNPPSPRQLSRWQAAVRASHSALAAIPAAPEVGS